MSGFRQYCQKLPRQGGVTLLAGLVMLAAISLLALVATASMLLQRRMASNFNDGQQARQAATAAVSQGAAFVLGLDHGERIPGCNSGCFSAPLNGVIHEVTELPPFPEAEGETWWSFWGTEVGYDPVSGMPVDVPWDYGLEPPRFLIEEIHFESTAALVTEPEQPVLEGVGYYRILGRGSGESPGAIAISEAIVARPWLDQASSDPLAFAGGTFCAPFEPWYDCGPVAWRERQ